MGNTNKQNSEKTELTAVKQQKKVPGRPFTKGVSGNPSGRPVGAKSFSTLFDQAIKEIAKEGNLKIGDPRIALVKKAIVEGLKGNYKYYRDIMDRDIGKPQEKVDLTSGGNPLPLLHGIYPDNNTKEDTGTKEEN
jgi:hypothetical protein